MIFYSAIKTHRVESDRNHFVTGIPVTGRKQSLGGSLL